MPGFAPNRRLLIALASLALWAGGLPAAPAAEVKFLASQPLAVGEATAAAVDATGRLLVSDADSGQLSVIAKDGSEQRWLAARDKSPLAGKPLHGIAALDQDRVLVVLGKEGELAALEANGSAVAWRFGEDGRREGQLDRPSAVAVSARGRVYVADRDNHRISVYTTRGVFLFVLSADLRKPTQVAVDDAERVYVLDEPDDGRLSVFDHRGALLKRVAAKASGARWRAMTASADGRVFLAEAKSGRVLEFDWQQGRVAGAFGSAGRGRGQFSEIVALAAQGSEIAVVDAGNKKIERYEWPAAKAVVAGEPLRLPTVVATRTTPAACTHAVALADGELLCADARNERVLRLGADGRERGKFSGPFDKPSVIALDERDVAIIDGSRIHIHAPDGARRFTIGRSGSRDGEFDDPEGVLIADRIYVSDTGNRRVQVFTRDGVFLESHANLPNQPPRFERPGALVRDARGNLFVADNGLRKVRVFGPQMNLLYEIGEDAKSPRRFERIHGLALDADGQLLVLAGNDANGAQLLVYSGPTPVFRFGHAGEKHTGLARAASLSLTRDRAVEIALYDDERKQLRAFAWHQLPGRVGGLAVRSTRDTTDLRWAAAPGSTVRGYRLYAADSSDGALRQIGESEKPSFHLTHAEGAARPVFFRVSAVTVFGVESPLSQPREDFLASGFNAEAKGNLAAAEAAYAAALAEDATNATALERLGRVLLAQGKPENAAARFAELARLPGSEATGAQLEIEALVAAKDFTAARGKIDAALAANRLDARGLELCGEVAFAGGDYPTAIDCLGQSLSRERDRVTARFLLGEATLKLGAIDKGFAEIEAALALGPREPTPAARAEQLTRAARLYQRHGRTREALARFEQALALDRTLAPALLGAARAHLTLKDYDRLRALAQPLAANPATEAAGKHLLGLAALASNAPQEAVLLLTQAARKDRSNPEIALALAEAQQQLGRTDAARIVLREALAAAPDNGEIPRQLARLEQKAGQHEAASQAWAKAVALLPPDAALRHDYAITLVALGHHGEAADQLREALRLDPKRASAWALLAEAARRQGKLADAIEHMKKAQALQPTSAAWQLRLGQLYLEARLYDQAQAALDKAAVMDSADPLPHEALGQLYLERQLFEAAIRSFTRATELGNDPRFRAQLNQAVAARKRSLDVASHLPRVLLQDLRFEPVFSASYKQYAARPIGRVRLTNAGGTEVKGLKLSFFIKNLMDFPVVQDVPPLKPKQSIELPLSVTFNNRILAIDEDTGVQTELKLLAGDGRAVSAELTQPMTVYGKNAIRWVDFGMVGSFVTPRDDVLREFVRRAVTQHAPKAPLPKNVLHAMTWFDVLGAYGVRYLVDPNSPYSRVRNEQVDTVQFPRETLRVKSGDCDDLVVLVAAGLENLGIETALVDVPGHLFLMFNTGVPAAERARVSSQDDLMVIRNGEVWLPVEATMIATSFSEAWAEGAKRFRETTAAKTIKVYPLKEVWASNPPVTLAQGEMIAPPGAERVAPLIDRERRILVAKSLDHQVQPLRARLKAKPDDEPAQLRIALIYAQNGLYDFAFREFEQVLAHNPRSGEAHNNRGNVYYLQEDYGRAEEAYRYAEELDPNDAGIKLNLALTHYQRGRLKEAADKFREAVTLDRALADRYQAFAKLLK